MLTELADQLFEIRGVEPMSKAKVTTSLFLAIFGVFVAMNALSNPRLETLHGPDILKLIAVGWCFGIAFGLLVADRFSGSKTAQS
jgi:hypothetical protein